MSFTVQFFINYSGFLKTPYSNLYGGDIELLHVRLLLYDIADNKIELLKKKRSFSPMKYLTSCFNNKEILQGTRIFGVTTTSWRQPR